MKNREQGTWEQSSSLLWCPMSLLSYVTRVSMDQMASSQQTEHGPLVLIMYACLNDSLPIHPEDGSDDDTNGDPIIIIDHHDRVVIISSGVIPM